MKKIGLAVLLLPMLLLTNCTSVSTFKKPSFKKCSNEVSFDDFTIFFAEKYKANPLLGDNGDIKKSMVFNGYSYGDAERITKTKNNKTMYDISISVSNKITAQYDSKRGVGNSDVETHRSESATSFKTSTVKADKESKIKAQYVKSQDANTIVGVYQKPKVYINLNNGEPITVSKYMAKNIESTFTFGDIFFPNYPVLPEETKALYHFYVDGDIFTITYEEEIRYIYHSTIDGEETEYATSLIVNKEKRQFILSNKPSYASSRTVKETTQYTRDFGERLKGDIETYSFSNYIKSTITFKYVNIKPISYKNYDCVTEIPAIEQ